MSARFILHLPNFQILPRSPGFRRISRPITWLLKFHPKQAGLQMSLSRLCQDECGGVSVDFMTLSGLLIMMAVGLIATMQTGTEALSNSTQTTMESAAVMELGELGQSNP
jgi:hypothetical protein